MIAGPYATVYVKCVNATRNPTNEQADRITRRHTVHSSKHTRYARQRGVQISLHTKANTQTHTHRHRCQAATQHAQTSDLLMKQLVAPFDLVCLCENECACVCGVLCVSVCVCAHVSVCECVCVLTRVCSDSERREWTDTAHIRCCSCVTACACVCVSLRVSVSLCVCLCVCMCERAPATENS